MDKSITAKKMTSQHQVYVVDYYVTKTISICQGMKSYDCESVLLFYYTKCKMHLNLNRTHSPSWKQEELNVDTPRRKVHTHTHTHHRFKTTLPNTDLAHDVCEP
jgi:hypothetical protein